MLGDSSATFSLLFHSAILAYDEPLIGCADSEGVTIPHEILNVRVTFEVLSKSRTHHSDTMCNITGLVVLFYFGARISRFAELISRLELEGHDHLVPHVDPILGSSHGVRPKVAAQI